MNVLVGQSVDVDTSCPEYKVVPVAVEPVARMEPALATTPGAVTVA